MRLTILCVTKGEAHALRFLTEMAAQAEGLGAQMVIGADGPSAAALAMIVRRDFKLDLVHVRSNGYVESVLDDALSHCHGEYVLRLDDDETCSAAMHEWLRAEEYRAHDHWKFCTANLWRDEQTLITDAPLWPDHHTRLSVREKSGGRHTPHAGSPFGGGELAPVIHCHHKFLVKSLTRRRALARHYERIGALLMPFTLPEESYDSVTLAPLGDGMVREWAPHECETFEMRKAVTA